MIRRARPDDATAIHALIHQYAGRNLLLPRPLADIYERIRDFWVADEGGTVVGCAALRIWWHDLAELRSLAVAADAQGNGHGALLVEAVAAEATRFGVRNLFALTRIEGWFTRHGFHPVDRALLYHKVWGDCASCPLRNACDEVAVVRPLVPGAADLLLTPDPRLALRVAHVVPPRAPRMPEVPTVGREPRAAESNPGTRWNPGAGGNRGEDRNPGATWSPSAERNPGVERNPGAEVDGPAG